MNKNKTYTINGGLSMNLVKEVIEGMNPQEGDVVYELLVDFHNLCIVQTAGDGDDD